MALWGMALYGVTVISPNPTQGGPDGIILHIPHLGTALWARAHTVGIENLQYDWQRNRRTTKDLK